MSIAPLVKNQRKFEAADDHQWSPAIGGVTKSGFRLQGWMAKISLPRMRALLHALKKQLITTAALILFVTANADEPVRPPEEIRTQLRVLSQASVTEIENLAEACFKNMNRAETMVARDLLLAVKSSPNREIALHVLIQHWARLNGPEAYEYAQTQQVLPKSNAMASALYGWAASDPAKAWDQLMIVSNRGADRRFNLMTTFDVIAAANLELALQLYEDLLPDRSCLKCCSSRLLVAASRTGDFDKILRALNRMPRGPTRDALRDEYWEYLGSYLPEWGLHNLKSLIDPEDAKAAEVNFCIGWSCKGFDDCMEYILKQTEPGRRDELILAAVQAWAPHAVHGDVVRVVKTLPKDLSERSLLGLATSLSSVDPEETLNWIKAFAYSEIRTTALGRAMTRWAKIDPDAAHEHIRNCADTETRGILLWYYLLAKLANNTLSFEELKEVGPRYHVDWRVRLFQEIAVELADPSINNGGKYDLEIFAEKIQARTDFSPEVKVKILSPLKRK